MYKNDINAFYKQNIRLLNPAFNLSYLLSNKRVKISTKN